VVGLSAAFHQLSHYLGLCQVFKIVRHNPREETIRSMLTSSCSSTFGVPVGAVLCLHGVHRAALGSP
jgi:hypothetical protein